MNYRCWSCGLPFVPPKRPALHSHDSLFWQEFHTPDGTSITWLQTSPLKCAEPCLRNPIKASDNNLPQFPNPLLRLPPSIFARAPSEPLDRSQPELLAFGQEASFLAPGCVCFHNCLAEQSEQPVRSALSTTERSRQKGSLKSGVLMSVSPSPTKPCEYYVSILVDLLNRRATTVHR